MIVNFYKIRECGFLKSDNDNLNIGFESIFTEQNEENLSYIKNEEESIIEKILDK